MYILKFGSIDKIFMNLMKSILKKVQQNKLHFLTTQIEKKKKKHIF